MKRAFLLLLGLGALAAAWLTPLPGALPGAFSRHMAVHMAVVAVAAPLITLGIAGTRFDPVTRAPGWFPPVPISVVELVVVWAWHAPGLHHFARHTTAGLALEQGSFLLSGMLVWLSAFGGAPEARQNRVGAGVLALLLTSMHMTLLGALLALPPRALYVHPGDSPVDALADQHLGGAIMLLVGGVVYLGGGLWLTARLLRVWEARKSKAADDAAVDALGGP
jgi:putative membrane protein